MAVASLCGTAAVFWVALHHHHHTGNNTPVLSRDAGLRGASDNTATDSSRSLLGVKATEEIVLAIEKDVFSSAAITEDTPQQSEERESLPWMQLLGADGIFDVYPLGECQGSCSSDVDCDDGLTCFVRENKEIVPGCQGVSHSRANYCISVTATVTVGSATILQAIDVDASLSDNPTAAPTTQDGTDGGEETATNSTTDESYVLPGLQIVGNGYIFDEYPLPLCKGDCDVDEDCAEGLACFHRRGYERVPGCDPSDIGVSGADYCIKEAYMADVFFNHSAGHHESGASQDSRPPPHGTDGSGDDEVEDDDEAKPETLETEVPVQVGRDEDDKDVPPTEAPKPAPTGSPTGSPTASPTGGPTASPTGGPTAEPTQAPTSAEPSSSPSSSAPSSTPSSGAPSTMPSEMPSNSTAPSFAPSENPSKSVVAGDGFVILEAADGEGEAADKEEEIVVEEDEVVVDVEREEADKEEPAIVDEETHGELSLVFDNILPLGECHGDCNSHEDCGPGLLCYHRNHDEMPIPGCKGHAPASADFCVKSQYVTAHYVWPIPEEADDNAEAQVEDAAWDAAVAQPYNETEVMANYTEDYWMDNTVVLEANAAYTFDPSTTEEPSNAPSSDATSASTTEEDELETTLMPEHNTTSPTLSPTTVSSLSEEFVVSSAIAKPDTMSPTESPVAGVSDSTESPTFSKATTDETGTLNVTGELEALHDESIDEATWIITNVTNATSAEFFNESSAGALTTVSPANVIALPPPSDSFPFLQMVGNDGLFDNGTYPLLECHGDCDKSGDCQGEELICMQRIANEPVPGCQGPPAFSVDYCVRAEYLMADNGDYLLDQDVLETAIFKHKTYKTEPAPGSGR